MLKTIAHQVHSIVIVKEFEKLIQRNLIKYLDKHNIVSIWIQQIALIEITNKSKKGLDEKNYVLGIYLDLI